MDDDDDDDRDWEAEDHANLDDPMGAGAENLGEEEEPEPASSSKDRPKAKAKTQKWTKAQLYSAYRGRGPHRMVFDFLHERTLREKCEILSRLGAPLLNKYAADLLVQKGNSIDRLRWYAKRSCDANESTVAEILYTVFTPEFQSSLRFTPRLNRVVEPNDSHIQDEVEVAQLASTFAANLAANYSWSQQMFRWTFPFAVAGLLSPLGSDQNLGNKYSKYRLLNV